MKPHTKIYMNFFGYKIVQDVACECCGNPAVDINHIEARGMGGNPLGDKDDITNLMAMCREHHVEYGDVVELKPMLKLIHLKYMLYNGIKSMITKLVPNLIDLINAAEKEAQNNVGNNIYDINPVNEK